jgi:hypothetical protein
MLKGLMSMLLGQKDTDPCQQRIPILDRACKQIIAEVGGILSILRNIYTALYGHASLDGIKSGGMGRSINVNMMCGQN